MRRDGIPYVPNPLTPKPQLALEEMDLQTIVRTRLRNCVKSNGFVQNCEKCENKCADGIRAIDLYRGRFTPNEVVSDMEPILERMRKAKEEAQKKEDSKKMYTKPETFKASDGRVFVKDWYKLASKESDPIEWIANVFNTSHVDAKRRIDQYNRRHPNEILLNRNGTLVSEDKSALTVKQEAQQMKTNTENKNPTIDEVSQSNNEFAEIIRQKIDSMSQEREYYKAQAEKWSTLYRGVDNKIEALKITLEAFVS